MTPDDILLAGVIGFPIAHSKSPALHGHWLKRYQIAGHYIPMRVSGTDLADVLRALPKLGFQGVNVTIPHKEAVLELADAVTDRAAMIGAANTLTFAEDGRVLADNTDGYGFLENLRQMHPAWQPDIGPALVLGAGGAARAIISALLQSGVPEILLTNRTKTRAEALKIQFGARVTVVDWDRAAETVEQASLLVNTTALGMTGKEDLRFDLSGLKSTTLVTDIVYTPLQTTLLRQAREAGCSTVDGLGMLLHQAVPGFERWFGVRPEVDDTLRQVVLG